MYKKIAYSLIFATLPMFGDSEVEDLKTRIESLESIIQTQKEQTEEKKLANALQNNSNSFSQRSFIPDISLIVDTSYVSRSQKDEELKHLEIPGIAHGIMGEHSHGGGHSHAPLNAHKGFNLNYAELALQSVVDPYIEVTGIFHLSENGFEIEEAYGVSRSLDYGLKAKFGKFRSEFGRINVQHSHSQDFADMPLVYVAFLGGHGIDDIGAQLQWTLPTDTYVMAGFEAFQGKNPSMYGTDAIAPAGDEENIVVASPKQPNLLVGYIKSSFDIENTTFLYGASIAYGDSRVNHLTDEEPHAFTGGSFLYGADLTIKHYIDSYSYLSFQGEYLYRDMDGNVYTYTDDTETAFNVNATRKKQSGYYAQVIYAYNQNWRAGIRYDNINKNDITVESEAQDTEKNFNRYTAMVDYSTSEFARFRLQYNHNRAMFNEDGERQSIDTFILEMNLAIGAHGAHNF